MVGFASCRSSIRMRMPSRSDSSLTSTIPSIFLFFARSAMYLIRFALFTRYGSCVTIIWLLPFGRGSMLVTARTTILPFPVVYASRTPFIPMMMPPVGKSGALMAVMISSIVVSLFSRIRLSIISVQAAMTSRRLCGGMFVAMPTAIPVVPLTRRFGKREGSTEGSFSVSSKFGTKSTVSLLMSARSSVAIFVILASV